MAVPLAPIVKGPIYTTSEKVLVSCALADASVELRVGGKSVGSKPAVINGNLWVPLSRALDDGEMVVAVQSLGGVTSQSSTNPVRVLDVPSPLPTPVFASPMSQFMSRVLLGGLVPGAKVEVSNGGTLAGAITATDTNEWVPVDPAVLAAGTTLSTVQKLGGQTSSPATSNKLVAVNAREVPPPKIEQPVRACDTALHVLECIPAADLVSDNSGNITLWTAISDGGFWATGASEFKPGPLKIIQRLPGAGTQSVDVVLTVAPALVPEKPTLQPFCPDAKRVAVSGLKPGAVLTLWKKVWDQEAETEIGSIGIGNETEQVDLPEVVGGSGPLMTIVARQSSCELISPPGSATEFARPGSGALQPGPPNITPPLYACARAVPCESLALVPAQLVSVRSGLPLSDLTVPVTPGALLWTWLPLVADDVVRIEQSGCGAPATSGDEPVKELPSPLPSPAIEPVRPGATMVKANGFLPGARAHLMVDWVVRASIDVRRKDEVFHLGSGLAEGAKLWAFQTLCNQSSAQEGPPVSVTKGHLSVQVNRSLVDGGVPASIIVQARDADTGTVLNGLPVQIGGVAVGLSGTAFNWIPPTVGTSAGGVVVGGSAYQNVDFSIAIRQAVPIALGLYVGEGASPGYAAMTDIEWSATPAWPGGVTKTLNAATGSVSIEESPAGGIVGVSVKLKVQLAADAFYGFAAETIDIPGGLLTNVALTKPSHAVSATLTVGVTTGVDADGAVGYRRFAKVNLFSLA